jgi:DNA-binding transcriptional ArsR family regulator
MEGSTNADPALDGRWRAYAQEHPLRARLLALVSERGRSLPELVEVLKQPPALVSYHWRVLEMAGLL